jgi:hypothetical protein
MYTSPKVKKTRQPSNWDKSVSKIVRYDLEEDNITVRSSEMDEFNDQKHRPVEISINSEELEVVEREINSDEMDSFAHGQKIKQFFTVNGY